MIRQKPHFLFIVRLLVCLLMVPAMSAQAAPPARKDIPQNQLPDTVISSFHRRAVNSTEKPWQSIGRVDIGLVHCSGTLIAPNIVLTAAHCLFNQETKEAVNPADILFLAGYAKGQYVAEARATAYIIGEGFDNMLGPSQQNMPYDWALLVLGTPLGETLGYMELHSNLKPVQAAPAPGVPRQQVSLPSSDVTTAGYPRDRGHVLSLEENCEIKVALHRGHVLMTDCIAIEGDSGGPMLQQENGQWVVIGTQTGATKIGHVHVGIGVSALAFRGQLQQLLHPAPETKPAGHGEN